MKKKKIGEYLVSRGILTEGQVEQILNYAKMKGMRFGEAGLEIGVLTREKLIEAFGPHYLVDFFHLVPEYYPQVTKDLLPLETIIRYGALPLGYKTVSGFFRTRKQLNLGLINPARADAVEEVTRLAREKVRNLAGVRTFLVLAEEYVSVLEAIYQVDAQQIPATGGDVDPTLQLFLDTAE